MTSIIDRFVVFASMMMVYQPDTERFDQHGIAGGRAGRGTRNFARRQRWRRAAGRRRPNGSVGLPNMERRAQEAATANADKSKKAAVAQKRIQAALAAVKLQKLRDAERARQDLLQKKREQLAVGRRQRKRHAAAQAKAKRAEADKARESRQEEKHAVDAISRKKKAPRPGLFHNMSDNRAALQVRHRVRDDVTVAVTPSVERSEAVQHGLRRDWNRKQSAAAAGLKKALVEKFAFEDEKTRVALAKAAAARRQGLLKAQRRMAKAAAGQAC